MTPNHASPLDHLIMNTYGGIIHVDPVIPNVARFISAYC